jgi:hypothetical protein
LWKGRAVIATIVMNPSGMPNRASRLATTALALSGPLLASCHHAHQPDARSPGSPGATAVEVVEADRIDARCTFLGNVSGSSMLTGKLKESGYSKAVEEMLENAAALGATHAVLDPQSKPQYWTTSEVVRANAFRCPGRPGVAAGPVQAQNPCPGGGDCRGAWGVASDDAFVAGAPQPNAYAVIVGIEHYEGLPPPVGARRDAQRFQRLVQQTLGVPEAHVHISIDDHATKGAIERDIAWARTNVAKGGRVYFYYSGHGAPDPSTGSAFVLPVDADPKFLNETAILLSDLVTRLGAGPAKDVIVILDSCFSGAGGRSVLAPGVRPLVRVREVSPGSNVALLTAATDSEIAGPASDGTSGLFSSYVLRGIGGAQADANGDGQITLQELFDWVKFRVARDAKQDNRDQTPKLIVGRGLGSASDLLVAWGLSAK